MYPAGIIVLGGPQPNKCRTPMRFASALQDRFTASLAKGRENYDWIGIALDVEVEAGITSGS